MKKTILCIDDIKTNLFTIQSVIEDLADELYDVVLAQSASDGLQVLLKQKIDIILLDVMMPDIDGFEAAKIIKSNKKIKDIPIVFVTANKDSKTIENCYKVGGDDYINKPFNHVELLARLSFHLKLKEKDEQLKKEKEYVQNILNLQENIVITTNSKEIINVNNAFLEFFDYKTLKTFQEKHICICSTFVEEDGYFSLSLVDENSKWVDEVIKLSKEKDVLVKIIQNADEYIFNIKAASFANQYIVTLTDITQISQQSLEYQHEANYDKLTQIY
ncbi:MAG: response regulator, partial [Campylobacterota bacterium]|nr:response regulator [Campylobacterota bacterium]